MVRRFSLLLLALLLLGVGARPAPPGCEALFGATSRGGATGPPLASGRACLLRPTLEEAIVVRVIDGDTIVLHTKERVRYIGVDAPEVSGRAEPYGHRATEFNRRLVLGKRVVLERDVSERDRYGRLLRYVYVDGVQVNAELVREGYARARAYPPDTKYQACLKALEQEARAHRRGMWAGR